jgi:hypothetical protein
VSGSPLGLFVSGLCVLGVLGLAPALGRARVQPLRVS